MNAPSLYLGSFNSEQFWREANISQLPTIADQQADAIVSVMDELQFVFCQSPHDALITRLPIDSSFREYLWELGFSFSHNGFPLSEQRLATGERSRRSICELLLENSNNYRDLLAPLSTLSPYAIDPFTEKLCQHYGLQCLSIDIEVVKKANSKLFSHQLAKHLFPDTVGEIIYSAKDLEAVGSHLLRSSPFLIKDEFGVSGKGNLLISSPHLLDRIVTHVSKQEQGGKQTRFLLEPLLKKQADFSCQLRIGATGEVKILTIQTMQNSGFAFSSIQTAELSFQEFLDTSGYFEQVNAIATELYRIGYCGAVCLDSMLLQSGSIIPIIEINARKSMGLINHYSDQFLAQFSTQGRLMFFSLGLPRYIAFAELLQRMEQAEILFLKNRPSGILPLASNTFNVNGERYKANSDQSKAYKGRFYGSVVADGAEAEEQIFSKMNHIFAELDIQRFN